MSGPRPPVFASAQISVTPNDDRSAAMLCVASTCVQISEHEAKALIIQLREAFELTPQVGHRALQP